MLFESIKKFNWVDIFIIILFLRICYIAFQSGFLSEFFKLLGTISAIYLSLHYYTGLSDTLLKNSIFLKDKMPLKFMDFLCFVILVLVGYLIFVLLRVGLLKIMKMEAVPLLHKWGGLCLGVVRAMLLTGLIVFMLAISTVGYFKRSVKDSFMGKDFFEMPVTTYSFLWDTLASKFMMAEKFNKNISEARSGLNR